MPMNRNELLNSIIDDGIEEIRITYTRPDQKDKRDGAMNGFEACRGKSNEELLKLYENAKLATQRSSASELVSYWFTRYRELQIEWVLNVLSAAMNEHHQEPLIPPTLRGWLKAADILGMEAKEKAS